jgi:hypothetical protein
LVKRRILLHRHGASARDLMAERALRAALLGK